MPEEDLARSDGAAERLGLSRSEYLRRLIAGQPDVPVRKLVLADLDRFARGTADLGDPEAMRGAWERARALAG
jgi:hypothetical protein